MGAEMPSSAATSIQPAGTAQIGRTGLPPNAPSIPQADPSGGRSPTRCRPPTLRAGVVSDPLLPKLVRQREWLGDVLWHAVPPSAYHRPLRILHRQREDPGGTRQVVRHISVNDQPFGPNHIGGTTVETDGDTGGQRWPIRSCSITWSC